MTVNRDRVIRAALELLDEVGLDGLTLRKLAAKLDVQAPTLYWHVKNKAALLDEMATTMLRDMPPPEAPPGELPWQDWITRMATGHRAALLRYRDGAKVFSGTYITDDTLLSRLEAPLAVLVDAGFTPVDAARAWGLVNSYVVGFTIEEQAVRPTPGQQDARYASDTRAARLDTSRYPLTHQAGPVLHQGFDERFAFGLRVLLAGLERELDAP
ncbi:TetR/AcrR family transcriptional regulator C-terminal domain-containing protein [Yinghuangia seranimata]|uniref:TetR/AcrR family transcriptional regulator C-terminal domain-containing protein n=1 Tax=Yinghuangia seranimata TaxID=408067 RepID=UPI00248D2196|nr:TetR/AcrR family transcriptional regulator C-terminal domain-containing protein [Yinghuangia seranimata]MDI2125213.1 TetR/AcrR family transcriptional regulator C-terminal domain-containing protein [Yinghuangia seranimata]